ncbi:MAG: ATP-binding cassette domain-containing protein [Lactobacillales bacterium]|nr:ATP-binding cassette domain-containing protein [Lactobacillales bacterium]
MIEIQGIAKSYGEKRVLSEIDLSVKKGKMTAFIGPNGAGKSTLLSLVSRLIPNEQGEIYLDHSELKAWKTGELAKRLAVLKQMNQLNLRLSVRELVSFGRFPYSKGRLGKKDEELVDKALENLGLTELAEEMIDSLSGGQLQRAYIAMVLAQDTEYILLDEPLNNLDMNYALQMMKLLRRLVDEFGKTVVIVLHDINFASSYADDIVAMKNGQVFASGSAEKMIDEEVLNHLYDMNIRICQIEGKRFCMYF